MIEQTCWCGVKFQAREADVKRGWAKACCKSHAAHAREKKLDRYGFRQGGSRPIHRADSAHDDQSWGSHKGFFGGQSDE